MANSNKRLMLRIFFGVEAIAFVWSYIFGSHGLYAIWQISTECKTVAQKIVCLHQSTADLRLKIDEIGADPFFKEEIAREKLQMARSDELIYYYEARSVNGK